MGFIERDYERFVEQVYEAPLEGATWLDALEGLSRAVGAVGTLVILARGRPVIAPCVCASLREMASAYETTWWRQDFAGMRAKRAKTYGLVDQRELCTPEEAAASPFFQEFMREHGIGGVHAFCDLGDDGANLALSVELPLNRPSLDEEERQILRRYALHASRALRMAARLETPLTTTAVLEDALDVITAPAAILGADKRVAFANPAFERLGRRGLRIVDRRLVAATPSQQGDLDRMIGEALSDAALLSDAGVIALRRPLGRPLVLQITPLPAGGRRMAGSLPAQRGALALVTDPDATQTAGETALYALGLTPAEAKLAMLVGAGLSPAQAAAQLGNSQATARTLLKRVFGKLGVERQAQLAHLIARLSTLA